LLLVLVALRGWWVDKTTLQSNLVAQVQSGVGAQAANPVQQALTSAQAPAEGLPANTYWLFICLPRLWCGLRRGRFAGGDFGVDLLFVRRVAVIGGAGPRAQPGLGRTGPDGQAGRCWRTEVVSLQRTAVRPARHPHRPRCAPPTARCAGARCWPARWAGGWRAPRDRRLANAASTPARRYCYQ
jgi:hypothetical protein